MSEAMLRAEYRVAKANFLRLYDQVCPPINREKIRKELDDLERESKDAMANLKYMVGRLYDGLAYGNW